MVDTISATIERQLMVWVERHFSMDFTLTDGAINMLGPHENLLLDPLVVRIALGLGSAEYLSLDAATCRGVQKYIFGPIWIQVFGRHRPRTTGSAGYIALALLLALQTCPSPHFTLHCRDSLGQSAGLVVYLTILHYQKQFACP